MPAEIFGHVREFRERMRRNELVSGPFISFADPYATEALAGSVDYFWYDMEHAPMSHEAMGGHLIACRVKRVPALVRIYGPNLAGSDPPWGSHIKPLLDMGADGVVIPQVRTVSEVQVRRICTLRSR
jgi:2-keto-3-deoxy-L-rhamnonate aldolase RhmA